MEETDMTLVAAVLVVGLLVGAGTGYYMAPVETVETVYVEPTSTGSGIGFGLTFLVYYAAGIGSASMLYDVFQEMRFQKWKSYVNGKLEAI